MTTILAKKVNKSGKFPFFSTFLFKAIFVGLGLVVVLGGASFVFLFLNQFHNSPNPLTFQKVFKETANADFERKILKEIDKNLVLQSYKRSLFPNEPFPPSYPFFAFTKSLQNYDGKGAEPFKVRVWCEGEKVQMEVYLFLRHDSDIGPRYEILPPISEKNPSQGFTFHIPATESQNRIIAIGRIDFPNGSGIKDLNKIIHLEKIK